MGIVDRRVSTAFSLLRARNGHDKRARRVVIVGNGMVSQRVCELLGGAHDARWTITVVGDEAYPAYDRIHLSDIVDPRAALIANEDWYRQRQIDLRLDCKVLTIERAAHNLKLSTFETLEYDVLVLATGSTPRVPKVPGVELSRVFLYRTIDDVLRIREALSTARSAVIVGGGLLGLEAARLSLDAGCVTSVLEASRTLMPRQLDPVSGEVLRSRVEALGARVALDTQLRAIEQLEHSLRLRVGNAKDIEADVVVIAIGVVPRDDLARECGLAVGARGGVIVDDDMRTTDASIYAVGDCACHAGRTYGLVAPGFAMAETLVGALRGERRPFTRGDASCELKLMGIPVAAVGNYEVDARSVTWRTPECVRTLLVRDGRLVGATAVGSWDELPRVRALAEQEKRISDRLLRGFEQTGRLFPSDESGIESWPEEAVVCNCRRVTKGELLRCVESCGPDVVAISARTGAGAVCGSCRPLLHELVGRKAKRTPVPYSRMLSVASAAVLVLVLILLAIPSLPFADSVQSPLHSIDRVRLDERYRQATGFVLVGFAALSLLLSLRKRTTWFARVPFGGARALHALLGGLALVALVTHTGLRMGSSLNFALFLSFVSAGLLGAIAGWASAAEGSTDARRSRQGRRVRRPMTLLHMLVLWPLPVLLGLHVLAAYYF